MVLDSSSLRRWALATLVLGAGCATPSVTASPSPAPAPAVTAPRPEAPRSPDARLSQEALRADLRQLVRLLEDSHPDPYSRAGGRIAFHRRVDELLRTLPPEGMTVEAFYRHVRPLVASLRDGHTFLRPPTQVAASAPLPLEFDAVEERLYVSRVFRDELRPLLGATLVGVEGTPFEVLSSRMALVRSADNRYHNLRNLTGSLRSLSSLGALLEQPSLSGPVRFALRRPDGSLVTVPVEPVEATSAGKGSTPPSRLSLPAPDAADLAWSFLSPDKSVALLRIDSMARYREAFEMWRALGMSFALGDHLTSVASAAGHPELTGVDERIAVIPSATDAFRDLFSAMRRERTATLIVDLRRNSGGNSFLANILGYFLAPREALLGIDTGYSVRRYSPLYFQSNQEDSLEKLRERTGLPLESGDLDFSEERAWREQRREGLTPAVLARRWEELQQSAALTPTFAEELQSGTFSASWSPRVIVLTSAHTYSAGFDLLVLLRALGATVVGVPSAQSGNCFIDAVPFSLGHSGLAGSLSLKYSLLYPEDPENGELLRPDRELRYEELAALGFDPNASVLLALEAVAPSPAPAATGRPHRAP
ncbi:MAG TPA: S41 family peptidase [Myxococcaceae bacterium]|nr:S41 family peptidase [Myxococcaceae bacterium]